MQFAALYLPFSITLALSFAAAANNGVGLRASYDCTCPGENVLYECTVPGGGLTVWTGGAFDCPDSNNKIQLLRGIDSTRRCNNGEITARPTHSQPNGRLYTSQLTVRVGPDGNGNTIECLHDDGAGNITVVGSTVLNITTEPLPPPNNLHLVKMTPDQLVFEWSEVASNCPHFHYRITSSNCGQCPNTTRNTTATCTGNFTTNSLALCTFAVRSVLCGDISGDAATLTATIGLSGINNVIELKNETSSKTCTQAKNEDTSLIIIISGSIIGSLIIVIVLLTTTFIITQAIAIRSNRALRQQLRLIGLKENVDQQLVIYEEIPQKRESRKISIETGDNSAYMSTTGYMTTYK